MDATAPINCHVESTGEQTHILTEAYRFYIQGAHHKARREFSKILTDSTSENVTLNAKAGLILCDEPLSADPRYTTHLLSALQDILRDENLCKVKPPIAQELEKMHIRLTATTGSNSTRLQKSIRDAKYQNFRPTIPPSFPTRPRHKNQEGTHARYHDSDSESLPEKIFIAYRSYWLWLLNENTDCLETAFKILRRSQLLLSEINLASPTGGMLCAILGWSAIFGGCRRSEAQQLISGYAGDNQTLRDELNLIREIISYQCCKLKTPQSQTNQSEKYRRQFADQPPTHLLKCVRDIARHLNLDTKKSAIERFTSSIAEQMTYKSVVGQKFLVNVLTGEIIFLNRHIRTPYLAYAIHQILSDGIINEAELIRHYLTPISIPQKQINNLKKNLNNRLKRLPFFSEIEATGDTTQNAYLDASKIRMVGCHKKLKDALTHSRVISGIAQQLKNDTATRTKRQANTQLQQIHDLLISMYGPKNHQKLKRKELENILGKKRATTARTIQRLIKAGILTPSKKGRSTEYVLNKTTISHADVTTNESATA